MSNAVFRKTMENVRKHRDIKFVTIERRRNYLISEPNYNSTKWFSENLLAIEMKKIKVKRNKSVHLGFSILEISKTLMYEFWYDYIKPKYQHNTKYNIWILIVLAFILKLKIFMKTFQMMLKKYLIHQIMKLIDQCLSEKIKK